MVNSWLYCSGRQQRAGSGRASCSAHDQRLDAAEQQEDEGGDEVALADLLVVDAGEPADAGPARVSQIALQAAVLARRAWRAIDARRRPCRSRRRSRQRLQIGDDLRAARRPDRSVVGICAPGLSACGIGDPAGEVAGGVGQRAGGEGLRGSSGG